jgi:hypothetical protein
VDASPRISLYASNSEECADKSVGQTAIRVPIRLLVKHDSRVDDPRASYASLAIFSIPLEGLFHAEQEVSRGRGVRKGGECARRVHIHDVNEPPPNV